MTFLPFATVSTITVVVVVVVVVIAVAVAVVVVVVVIARGCRISISGYLRRRHFR